LRRTRVFGDFWLIAVVLALLLIGVGMVFSATYYTALTSTLYGNDPYYFLVRAAAWAVFGLGAMVLLSRFNFEKWAWCAPLFMLFAVALLGLLFTPLGEMRNYAVRSMKLGPVSVMPGEIAKLAAIWFVAWYYTKYEKKTKTFLVGYVPPLALMGVCFFLIYKQPNLSTALILCGIMLAMMFIAGTGTVYTVGVVALLGAAVFFLIVSNPDSEHAHRLIGYLDPWSDAQGEFYQTVQALLALGAGGVFGTGLGGSVSKALYLPESQTDYIFAIIGEEFGFVGCIVLLLLYLVLIWRCTLISLHATSRHRMLVGCGITIMVALEVILNVGVVTNLVPPTGVTLPFISYGGNAMLLFMGSMGIMLNISRDTARADLAALRASGEDNVIDFAEERKMRKKKKKANRKAADTAAEGAEA